MTVQDRENAIEFLESLAPIGNFVLVQNRRASFTICSVENGAIYIRLIHDDYLARICLKYLQEIGALAFSDFDEAKDFLGLSQKEISGEDQ